MTDEKTFDAPEEAPAVEAPAAEVAAPANAQVGDENVGGPRAVDVAVNDAPVAAQTTGPAAEVVTTVKVHETAVRMDKVITDPHSPEAVQIPDAGRGSLDLPIHALTGKTVEEIFAEKA